jgi:vitamin-K-epoxide reductase (warfarin-sensitive)
MSQRAAVLALTCALVGLAASGAAAYTHYHILNDPTYRSFCDVSTTISCTQVYQSRFGTLRGIPVAIFGGLFFVAATLLSIAGLKARPQVRESVPGYLFFMSTLALAVVLYLGYASFFVLKAVCLLCLTTYAAVIGLFLVSGAATSFPMTSLPRRASRDARVFLSSPLALTLAALFSPAPPRPSRSFRAKPLRPRRRRRAPGPHRPCPRPPRPRSRNSSGGTRRSRAWRSSCRRKARRCWS